MMKNKLLKLYRRLKLFVMVMLPIMSIGYTWFGFYGKASLNIILFAVLSFQIYAGEIVKQLKIIGMSVLYEKSKNAW